MEDQQIGWLAAILVGGFAGWIAEKLMKSDQGVLMNVILGIVGAAIANVILSMIGVITTGWIGYLIAGVIGASLLIAGARLLRGRKV